MKCEQTIINKYGWGSKGSKRKCGKPATNVDEAQRGLCLKHFKKWHIKKYGYDFNQLKDK